MVHSNRASSHGGAVYIHNYVYLYNRYGNSYIQLEIVLYNFIATELRMEEEQYMCIITTDGGTQTSNLR